jgi:hypothetical protein
MVEVVLRDDKAIFKPRGWSKLWTLRTSVKVPLSAIRGVRKAASRVADSVSGLRLPGTYLPGVIVAGSYREDGQWTFWDVRGSGDNAIEVDLDGVKYRRLIIDVADPEGERRRLQAAIASRAA